MNRGDDRPDPVFFLAKSDRGFLLINLYQITTIEGVEGDRFTIHLSSGESCLLADDQATAIFGLLEQFSVDQNGEPLRKSLSKYLGPQLIKSKPKEGPE